MTEFFSEDHIVTMVPGLTLDRLFSFVHARLVIPTTALADGSGGQLYSLIDIARLQFLCELSDDLGLDEPTLDVVMALVDKLHAARADLRSLVLAIGAEDADVRTRIGMVFMRSPRPETPWARALFVCSRMVKTRFTGFTAPASPSILEKQSHPAAFACLIRT